MPRPAPNATTPAATEPATATAHEEAIARYEAVLLSALDPIVTIDASGSIQSASRSVRRVFGYEPEELVGRNVSILMPEPHRSDHDGYLERYRRTGRTNILGRTREFEGVRKDGSRFPLELSVARADVPGQQPLFIGVIRDITERKSAEAEIRRHRDHLDSLVRERTAELERSHEQLRLADRLASIGTLAAGLGHDMNNVLFPVRCQLDALDEMQLPEEARTCLTEVARSVAYLQHLADALHLLSRDSDDDDDADQGADLAWWWSQVGGLLGRAVRRPANFEASFPPGLPPIRVTPHRLTQAMLNLIVNAADAINPDTGHVRVWAEPLGDRAVRLGVSDDGAGMSEDVRRRALDPFFTTKKRGLGTGLGLALVRSVVLRAGGAMDIQSTLGRGTTVTLDLPVAAASPAPATASRPQPGAVVSVADARRATLVEALLHAAGFHVSAEEAPAVEGATLWVVETPVRRRDVKQFLAGSRRRRIVVLGRAGSETAGFADRAIIVENPDSFDDIRQAIALAAVGVEVTL